MWKTREQPSPNSSLHPSPANLHLRLLQIFGDFQAWSLHCRGENREERLAVSAGETEQPVSLKM